MEPIFESRGRFWFAERNYTEEPSVPEGSTPGNLTIRQDGVSRLSLDGCLTDGLPTAMKLLNTGEQLPGLIVGFLYKEAEFVVLADLDLARSQTNYAGANREELTARYCLRGFRPPLGVNEKPVIQELKIDLSTLEDWMRPHPIRATSPVIEGARVSQTFEYWRECWDFPVHGKNISFEIGIDRDFENVGVFGSKRVEFSSAAVLGFRSNDAMDFEEVRNAVMHMQEFLALVMGTYTDLNWPRVIERSNPEFERHGTFYFSRHPSMNNEVSIADLWTLFPSIKGSLGSLFDTFQQRREELGPGLYLYLACLRTQTMFPENRFTTLMTGLESLYRRDVNLPQASTRDQQRIARILQAIQLDSDRNWLEKRIASRSELSLEDKLCRLLSPLDSILKSTCIAEFAKQCASLRNDITHFGGLRGDATYSELMKRLRTLIPALSDLYHALLLQRIGFAQEAVITALKESSASHKINSHFTLAGIDRVGQSNLASYLPDED